MKDFMEHLERSCEPHIIRIGERGRGKVHAFAIQLEEIANSRRDLFIKDLEQEITAAIYQNQDVRSTRIMRNRAFNNNEPNPYEDPFLELVRGKIEALRGILEYIAEQKKLFTYHDTDPTTYNPKGDPK